MIDYKKLYGVSKVKGETTFISCIKKKRNIKILLLLHISAIESADTLIIAGTSLTVYPAAGFVRFFRGENIVLINRDKTPFDSQATLVFHVKVGKLLDKIKVN